MSTVIKVESLSKQYRLGVVGATTFKEDAYRWWAKIRGKEDPFIKLGAENDRTIVNDEKFVWSLKDLNFEVMRGDVLGIIGRNGAGKSTLLKILSKVTAPTTGKIKVKGRIASLLEVGTGFHPELTGRENIYLNGAILGMRKYEIKQKLAEIIDFAGVEKYIDTPVKRYSSGMYVRLAFAVAAYLESEILIIDEVLAVGDAEFQKKCLGKINNISNQDGRTVLFVSHNLAAVNSLCNKGLVLSNGQLLFEGSQNDSVDYYMSNNQRTNYYNSKNDSKVLGNKYIEVISFKVSNKINDIIKKSNSILFELIFFNFSENIDLDITFELSTIHDIVVFHRGTILTNNKDSRKGKYNISFELPPFLLNSGMYKMNLIFGKSQRVRLFDCENVIQFEVLNESYGSNSYQLPGVICPEINYNVEFSII